MKPRSRVHFFEAFDIGDKYVSRYPIVSNAVDGVILPIAAFIHYRLENSASEKSLESDAYCLSEFWDYLAAVGVRYDLITADILRRFLDSGAKRTSNIIFMRSSDAPLVYKETLRRKRSIIYNFYHVLQNRLGIVKGILEAKEGKNDTAFRLPAIPVNIGLGVPRARDNDNRSRHDARQAKERKRRPKPTPSPEEADELLDHLLDGREQNRGSTYYLAASLEILGGARGCGVEDLTVSSLADSLMEEPELLKVVKLFSSNLDATLLIEAAHTPLGAAIVRGLKALGSSGRRYIFAMVIEKGKVRPLAIPVNLALEILDYIWSDRQEFIRLRQTRNSEYLPPDNVFLSYKTGRALRSSSISRVVAKTLRESGIPGTPHRLRATFAEQVVRDLYFKDRDANGGKADFISIIQLAREMLGHSNNDTIRKYLNNILKKDRLLKGHVIVLNEFEDVELVERIVRVLQSKNGPIIRDRLESMLSGL